MNVPTSIDGASTPTSKNNGLTALHVAEEVGAPVAHRQVVLTIPKRLRPHARFDRNLPGKLAHFAWTCIQKEVRRHLGRDDLMPGMVTAIQTLGKLLHGHPHLHALVTCGDFTPEGGFAALPQFGRDRLLVAWQEAVFALYLAEGKIEPEVVENMRTSNHSGLSVDPSVLLRAGDQAGIERLVQYMTRCPFSLSRLVKVTETGQVVYKAEQQACRAFPDQQGDGIASGPQRNFQIFSPLDLLAPPPPQTGHAAYSGEGLASDSLRWLVLQQGAGAAEESGRGSIRRAIPPRRRVRWVSYLL